MAVTLKPYTLNSYTPGQWTTLAASGLGKTLVIRHLSICNTGADNVDASVRMADSGGTVLCELLHGVTISTSNQVNYGPMDLLIVLENAQQLQVKGSAAGLSFYAGGGIE